MNGRRARTKTPASGLPLPPGQGSWGDLPAFRRPFDRRCGRFAPINEGERWTFPQRGTQVAYPAHGY